MISIEPKRRRLAVLPAAAALLALWLEMTDAQIEALLVGVPCVAFAVLTLRWLGGDARLPRMGAALVLVPGFLAQSIQGAVEIATRAFGLKPLPSPCSIRCHVALPYGRGRVLFMDMVSLIPGTLSMCDDGECLHVHVLDRESAPQASLIELERRVANVFPDADGGATRA